MTTKKDDEVAVIKKDNVLVAEDKVHREANAPISAPASPPPLRIKAIG
jgi:hypothetical protein